MIFDKDPYLEPYIRVISRRYQEVVRKGQELAGYGNLLKDRVNNHLYYGVHRERNERVFREWMPNAVSLYLIGECNGWREDPEYAFRPVGGGNWELRLPLHKAPHGMLFRWSAHWRGGGGERLPAYATRCVQDPRTKQFSAQIWDPDRPYRWKHAQPKRVENPLIYEVHIGMSAEEGGVASFSHFRQHVLPKVIDLGYNTLQIMALQEHPYYGSFGYQVANFYALSSRFGTPDEFKRLVDEAHKAGIAVVMDVVHSHAVKNEQEGLGCFDGTTGLYFHEGERGEHPAWGTRCFDYGKEQTLFFLLSNLKFWLEEYRLDGFRFDGVTSMIYLDHGLGRSFVNYEPYFDGGQDEDALTYLGLANRLVHEVNPDAITIAEEVSGMPGLAAPLSEGGFGFDFRMSMGIADYWIKWIKERADEDWSVGEIFYQCSTKRADERTISYAECHDQALVGDQALLFRLLGKEIYTGMEVDKPNLVVERGIALHKMIRLVTLGTAGDGYLTFMGNEFGHPEWIDFPREGNGWSYHYARRQWSLADNPRLRYGRLRNFERAILHEATAGKWLHYPLEHIWQDEQRKILIFKRGRYIFALNFNPLCSFSDFCFEAPAGKYRWVLDTDQRLFDGFDRVEAGGFYFTHLQDQKNYLSIYLPSRTAVVLKMED